MAVLPDGRVVSGGDDGRVLAWDPAGSGTGPAELGRHDDGVRAVSVLPDGRVVSGGYDGRVLVWDPAELGRHHGWVWAVAVLPDGRVVSGGDDGRVLVWDPDIRIEIADLRCSVIALASGPLDPGRCSLVIAHQDAGFSVWSVIVGPG